MRCLRVSSFFAEVTQQIHSLRASDVISFHAALIAAVELRAARKSAGNLCTMPTAFSFFIQLS